jgi:FkbM family methyltransferase
VTGLGSIKQAVKVALAHRDTTIVGSAKRIVNAQLSRCGLGVAYGTPWLYAAFPGAKFCLVDPTREPLPHMETWAKKLDAEVHNVALASESTSLKISTRSTIIHSSLLPEVTNRRIEEQYDVPARRFDALFATFERPAFCKIDVEGAEFVGAQRYGRSTARSRHRSYRNIADFSL